MSETTPTTKREGDDDGVSVALGVLAGTVGLLLILLYVLAWFAAEEAAASAGGSGTIFSYARWVLAAGAGLVALGIGLVAPTIARFLGQQRGVEALNQFLTVLLGGALLVLVNYVFARHDLWRWDLTSEQQFTMSEEAHAFARALKVEAKIWLVPGSEDATPKSELDTLEAFLRDLSADNKRITLKVTRPLSLIGREEATQLFEELEKAEVRSADEIMGVTIKVGQSDGEKGWTTERTRFIRWAEMWDDPRLTRAQPGGKKVFLGEQRVLGALRELAEPEKPRIYFLEGHEELRASDFDERKGLSSVARALRDRNWQVEPLRLADREKHDIPADARALVVAAPRLSLPPADVAAIDTWIAQGGDAIFLLDPVVDRKGADLRYVKSGLEAMLEEKWGVVARDRTIWKIQATGTRQNQVMVEYMPMVDTASYEGSHPVVRELAAQGTPVLFDGVRPLILKPVAGIEQKMIVEAELPPGYPKEGLVSAEAATKSALRDELQQGTPEVGGPYTLGVAVEKVIDPTHKGRIVVLGDADFATNALQAYPGTRNLELLLGAVNWCAEREEQTVGKAVRQRSYRLTMAAGELEFFKAVSMSGMPALAVALGVIAWILRRG